ncbi:MULTISPECIES: hypothetical protein [Noviherbaspirillum]|uniref:hypothetical protein n=1 Tax=Noviherbaspirillum TaxID=1344552 RepID=UPI00124E34ED|nr:MULTISPECIES: hypothetical protein [Noviherbaspirillum]
MDPLLEGPADGPTDEEMAALNQSTVTVACRMPKWLLAEVADKSAEAEITVSRFVRDAVEAAIENKTIVINPRPAIPPKMKVMNHELHRLFASVSNNCNQLARRVHYDHLNKQITDKTYAAVAEQLAILIRVLEARLPP